VAKKLGWKSAYQSDKFRRSEAWQDWLIKIGEAKVNYELDEYGKPIYIGPDVTYRGEIVRDAYVVRQRELRGENLKPEGPAKEMREDELGRLLIGIGRRESDDWWGAGDTPK